MNTRRRRNRPPRGAPSHAALKVVLIILALFPMVGAQVQAEAPAPPEASTDAAPAEGADADSGEDVDAAQDIDGTVPQFDAATSEVSVDGAGMIPPPGSEGTVTSAVAGNTNGLSVAAAVPVPAYAATLRGGYVASGVGLRNRGFGTVVVSGIPAGATVVRAYLLWSILGGSVEPANFKTGRVSGVPIAGVKVGQGPSPCWTGVTTGYAYRADVTARVPGNGSYALSGFATGQANGADPFISGSTAPLAEGASLVVVFSKTTAPAYPMTRVVIANGYQETQGAVLNANIPYGIAASNPVGEVRTTFIGADGQMNVSEPASTFNGTAVTAADWDGTDRPLPRYSQGNLWDTDTASVGRLVKPGQTSANVSVTGGGDCLAWVGQVVSIGTSGGADTDGDRLLDGWEANGYDANGDGVIDVPLPTFGASVVRKDLFVEMDYMGAEAACPCHLPLAADLNRIVNVFATAPFANNPNGATGIRLHLDAGAPRGAAFNLGGGNLVAHDSDLNPVATQFNAIKLANFNPLRAKIFYYMIWAHNYNGGSSSGNAFAIPNDSFVVTLGSWPSHGTSDAKVGTFIHEFGHTLGLQHGGNEGKNYKPNYLSVMQYGFQTSGVLRTGATAPYFGYSRFTLPSLNENALSEPLGLNSASAATYRTRWYCPSNVLTTGPGTANGPLDWNCSGVAAGAVLADINGDGVRNTLTSFNDWSHLVYGGGAVGAGADAGAELVTPMPSELTFEESQHIG